MWIFFLSVIVGSFFSDVDRNQRFLRENPIDTTISLRPMEEVPFPAIIIDVGDPVDPMGYVRASHNMVEESKIPRKGKQLLGKRGGGIYSFNFVCS